MATYPDQGVALLHPFPTRRIQATQPVRLGRSWQRSWRPSQRTLEAGVAPGAQSASRANVAAHLTALKACRMLGAWQHAIGILGVLAASARAPWLSQLQQLATSAAADFSAAAETANDGANGGANGGAHRPPPVFDMVVRETTPRASFDDAFHEMAVSHAMGACVRPRDASGQPSAAALDAAHALLSMLEQHGLARAAHYGVCMHALVLRGQPGSAFELYHHARRQGVTFGVIESNVALSAAARADKSA